MTIDRYRRALIKLPILVPIIYGVAQVSGCTAELTEEERIRADFLAGRTVVVEGWILSEHEASLLEKEK